MLCVVMLIVIMLIVILLSGVAPSFYSIICKQSKEAEPQYFINSFLMPKDKDSIAIGHY
jgi:hypothetical protein